MKVKLNADWLTPSKKAKLYWVQDVKNYFNCSWQDIKPLADYFFEKTNNLESGNQLVVDINDFEFLKNLDYGVNVDNDIWFSYSKSIQHEHTEYDKKQMKYEQNPFLYEQEQLAIQEAKLLALIHDNDKSEAKNILEKIYEMQSSLNQPRASA